MGGTTPCIFIALPTFAEGSNSPFALPSSLPRPEGREVMGSRQKLVTVGAVTNFREMGSPDPFSAASQREAMGRPSGRVLCFTGHIPPATCPGVHSRAAGNPEGDLFTCLCLSYINVETSMI